MPFLLRDRAARYRQGGAKDEIGSSICQKVSVLKGEEMFEVLPLPGGKWTFFLIDVDESRVVEVLELPPGQQPGPDLVHRAAALTRETGHRYSIAQSRGFIESARGMPGRIER